MFIPLAHLPGACCAGFDAMLNNLGIGFGLVVGAIAHRAERGVTSRRRSILEFWEG